MLPIVPKNEAKQAIMLARRGRAHGGAVTNFHVGPIRSAVAGRTDHLPTKVQSGSFVFPADFVSHLGQSNTEAGFKVLRRMFGGMPYHGGEGPYGSSAAPYGEALSKASGGATEKERSLVPVVMAGGEYVLSPHQVVRIGEGDIDVGHKVLDKLVMHVRDEHIKTLQKLPPPAKD